MSEIDISAELKILAARRPIFHSEADFQHEFAWRLHEDNADLAIRLEHPLPGAGNKKVDILLRRHGQVFAIELKYLCHRLHTVVEDENFALKSQAAQDLSRYDVFHDIERMEHFVRAVPTAQGAVIVLSNDPVFWNGPKKPDTNDAAFALKDGRTTVGKLDWSEHTGAGTKRGREKPIELANRYVIAWQDFSQVTGGFGRFRFLHVPIPASAPAV